MTDRQWPPTATPEIIRKALRGDCIAPAHARISDIFPCGLDAPDRARLAEVLAQVWDDGWQAGWVLDAGDSDG